MAKTKDKIKVTVLEVFIDTDNPEPLRLAPELNNILDKTDTANDRKMLLNENEPEGDCDLIPSFKYQNNHLFGTFIRLRPGEETVFPASFLDKKIIDINDIIKESGENSIGTVQETVFFLIKDNILVMSDAYFNMKPFETYLKWLLENFSNTTQSCKLNYKMKTADAIPLKDVRSIKIGENYLSSPAIQSDSQKFKIKIFKDFLKDVKLPQDFAYEDVIDAVLTLKVKKKIVAREKALNTLLRIVDDKAITITDRKGKKVDGSGFKMTEVYKIEKSEGGYYNEVDIKHQMYDTARRALDEKVADQG